MDKRARGSEWALGLQGWCREGPAGWSGAGPGRTAGTGEAVGSVERMEARGRGGQGCCQTLTSFAVSSHDGVSAVEPDAADDRELGIRPVQPLIVIIHGQAWGDSAVRPRLPASGRGDAELSPCGDRPTPFPQPPPIALLEKLRLPIRGSCPLPSFPVTSSHPPLPRPAPAATDLWATGCCPVPVSPAASHPSPPSQSWGGSPNPTSTWCWGGRRREYG